MGKIFGISNNPVSTIESAIGLKKIEIQYPKFPDRIVNVPKNLKDSFVSCECQKQANAFVKMRNGFGKLMPDFRYKK